MTVHILGGGMGDDVASPLKGTAVDGCGKGVVDNQWHTVAMGYAGKLLDVEHLATGIGDGFAEHRLGIGAECLLYLFLGGILIDKRALDAELLQCNAKEIERTSIYLVGSDDMVASLTDVEHGKEIGCLTRRGKHSPHSTLEGGYLASHGIVGGILQTSVEIALLLEVEQERHLIAVVVFECSTLHYGQFYRLSVFRLIA